MEMTGGIGGIFSMSFVMCASINYLVSRIFL
jgi:hypothetical protein